MKSKSIQNTVCLFSAVFCGAVFSGIRSGDNPFSSLVSGALGAVCAFAVCIFYIKIKNNSCGKRISQRESRFFCFAAMIFSCLVCAANAFSFAANLGEFSQKLSGARFSQFFIILCFALCAYAAKRGFELFSRICLILIVPLALPYVVSWFSFIGYSTPAEAVLPSFSLHFDTAVFLNMFSVCIPLTVFFIDHSEETRISEKGLYHAFLAFIVVFFLESLKYFFFFGRGGVSLVKRPDRIMLASVPFVNVQDLFVFSYFFAFMLRTTLLFAASSKLIEKAFTEKKSAVFIKSFPALISYLSYVLLCFLPGFRIFSMSPFAAIVFAIFVLAASYPTRIKQNK